MKSQKVKVIWMLALSLLLVTIGMDSTIVLGAEFAEPLKTSLLSADFSNNSIDYSLLHTVSNNTTYSVSDNALRFRRTGVSNHGGLCNFNPVSFNNLLKLSVDVGANSRDVGVTSSTLIGIRQTSNTAQLGSTTYEVWIAPGKNATTSTDNSILIYARSATTAKSTKFALPNLNTVLSEGGTPFNFGTFTKDTVNATTASGTALRHFEIEDNGEWIKFFMTNDDGVLKLVASLRTYFDASKYAAADKDWFNAADVYYGDGSSSNSNDYKFAGTIGGGTSTDANGSVRFSKKDNAFYKVAGFGFTSTAVTGDAGNLIISDFSLEYDGGQFINPAIYSVTSGNIPDYTSTSNRTMALTENKDNYVKFNYLKNSYPDNCCIIVAMYDNANNQLLSAEVISKAQWAATPDTYFSLGTPVDNYKLKIFVWDEIGGVKPMGNYYMANGSGRLDLQQ